MTNIQDLLIVCVYVKDIREGLEGGKRRENLYDYTIISKIKK